MRSVLESAVRQFSKSEHIKNVLDGEWINLLDESGKQLPGIRGRVGAFAITCTGYEIGADLIEMQPGSAFALHTHPGDHILYVIKGRGCVAVDGRDNIVDEGDTIFIPAEYPHGVKTIPEFNLPFTFLAFGHPHKHLGAMDRMRLVKEVGATQAAKAEDRTVQ
jgi:quercetin dioxygenase-like cupin family protein